VPSDEWSIFNVMYRLLHKLVTIYCRIWNRQYYKYKDISRDVVFASSFPATVKIISPSKCSIGKGSVVNGHSIIHCAGGVHIGEYVHIGHGLCIYSTSHNYASNQEIPYGSIDVIKPVEISDCVWIGANVSIVPGVKIGEGAVVGMGAVVTKDVPPGAIIGGNPAQVLGYRDMDTYFRLKNEGKFR